jgi:hypothetical protein
VKGSRRRISFLILACLVFVTILPLTAHGQVSAFAETSGFGAAFGYAQNIGGLSYTVAGTIGNGHAGAEARSPFAGTFSMSEAASLGNGSAFATALGTPFGSTAWTQVSSLNGGWAGGFATAGP